MIAKSLFRLIWKTYVWSSTFSSIQYLGSRLVEYPFVVENISVPKGAKILLVGCAGDPLSTILPALKYETYGLDIKHVPVKYPNFKFIRGDIRNTEFPDENFDSVIAVSTIEHVGMHESDYEGDKKAIKEMTRILKLGGPLLITVPVASRSKTVQLERFYDPKSLDLLLQDFMIRKKVFFRIDRDGYWVECSPEDLPEPDGDKAVALIVATKVVKRV